MITRLKSNLQCSIKNYLLPEKSNSKIVKCGLDINLDLDNNCELEETMCEKEPPTPARTNAGIVWQSIRAWLRPSLLLVRCTSIFIL